MASAVPGDLRLPEGFANPRVAMPGILAVEGPRCPAPSFDYDELIGARAKSREQVAAPLRQFCDAFSASDAINQFRIVLVVDDSQFVSESLRNFLWAVFTRANPADDLWGIDSFVSEKHWGCRGALVIDARVKPHHAPLLEEDPATVRRVEELAAPGGPLHGLY